MCLRMLGVLCKELEWIRACTCILLETTEEIPGRIERTDRILYYMHSPDPRICLPCFPPRPPRVSQ